MYVSYRPRVTDILTFAAPIIEAGVIDRYDTVFFNGTINFKEKWAGPPNDARDKLWNSVIYGRSHNIFPPVYFYPTRLNRTLKQMSGSQSPTKLSGRWARIQSLWPVFLSSIEKITAMEP